MNEQAVEMICDICGEHEEGTVSELRSEGWEITTKHAFCLVCSEAV